MDEQGRRGTTPVGDAGEELLVRPGHRRRWLVVVVVVAVLLAVLSVRTLTSRPDHVAVVASTPTALAGTGPVSMKPVDPTGTVASSCLRIYQEWQTDDDETPAAAGPMTARVVANDAGPSKMTLTTAVVSDGVTRVVCNTQPSTSLSEPTDDTVDDTLTPADFAFSESTTINYGFDDHDLIWAGGRVSPAVAAITYTLPGNHQEAASIGPGGYWVMQYASPGPSMDDFNKVPAVEVAVAMTDGSVRTFTLAWGESSCAAVNHGC